LSESAKSLNSLEKIFYDIKNDELEMFNCLERWIFSKWFWKVVAGLLYV